MKHKVVTTQPDGKKTVDYVVSWQPSQPFWPHPYGVLHRLKESWAQAQFYENGQILVDEKRKVMACDTEAELHALIGQGACSYQTNMVYLALRKLGVDAWPVIPREVWRREALGDVAVFVEEEEASYD